MRNNKLILKICELFLLICAIINTIILCIIRNTISFEEMDSFEPISKSSVFVIMHHFPVIKYVYVFCIVMLLLCELYRLILIYKSKHLKKDR